MPTSAAWDEVTMNAEGGHVPETSGQLDWLISVDDHLIEPPHVWTSRASAADRDRVPQVITDENDVLCWVYEDVRTTLPGVVVQAGRDESEIDPRPVKSSEMREEYWDSVARTKDMDKDGVLAAMCFPFFPRFCGQTFYEAKDRDLALKCLKAYNDWVIEDWSGSAPGRYIPLMIIPLWDPEKASDEIHRCADKGAKAIAFSENPSKLGLPSMHEPTEYWHPVFQAANDTGLPLSIHFGSSSTVPKTSDDCPLLVWGALSPMSLAFAMTDWLFSKYLPRYPNLRITMAEGGIGWIPYMLERCDNILKTQSWTQKTDLDLNLGTGEARINEGGGRTFDRLPSELFRDHFFGCFIEDHYGARSLEDIGVDNVMIETDYPHGDSTFPNSIKSAHEHLKGYPADVQYKVLQGNARRVFNLEPEVFVTPSR